MTMDGALAMALLRAENENEQLRKMVTDLQTANAQLEREKSELEMKAKGYGEAR